MIITLLLVTLKATGYVLLQMEKVEFKGKNSSMLNPSLPSRSVARIGPRYFLVQAVFDVLKCDLDALLVCVLIMSHFTPVFTLFKAPANI